MKNLYYLLSLLILTSLSFSTSAETLLSTCNYCSSSYSYESVAKYTAINNSSQKSNAVFVVNFNNQKLYKFRVVNIKSLEPGVPDSVITQSMPLTSSDLYYKNKLFDNLNAIQGYEFGSSGEYIVPEEVAESAYDLIGSSSTENSTIKNYLNNQTVETRVEGLVSAVLSIAGKVVNVNFVMEMSFSDYSVGTFAVTGIDGSGNIELELISVVDEDGNDVPLTKDGFKKVGEMSFNKQGNDGIQNFISAAARYGISITLNGSGSSNSASGSMDCVVTSGGLQCTYTPDTIEN